MSRSALENAGGLPAGARRGSSARRSAFIRSANDSEPRATRRCGRGPRGSGPRRRGRCRRRSRRGPRRRNRRPRRRTCGPRKPARAGAAVKSARCSVKPSRRGTSGSAASRRSALRGRHRLRRGLVGDLSAQGQVTGEGVDVALLDAVEPQTEQQVFANEAVRLHDIHANCKTWPGMARLSELSTVAGVRPEFEWRALRMSTRSNSPKRS